MNKLVLIDGDEAVATSLQAVLESEGHEVEVRKDVGGDFFPMLSKTSFDLVIYDLSLPPSESERLEQSKGFQFLKQICAVKPGVPVIVISTDCSLETAISVTKLGAFEYLSKPFDMSRLIGAVDQIRSREQTDWGFHEEHTFSFSLLKPDFCGGGQDE